MPASIAMSMVVMMSFGLSGGTARWSGISALTVVVFVFVGGLAPLVIARRILPRRCTHPIALAGISSGGLVAGLFERPSAAAAAIGMPLLYGLWAEHAARSAVAQLLRDSPSRHDVSFRRPSQVAPCLRGGLGGGLVAWSAHVVSEWDGASVVSGLLILVLGAGMLLPEVSCVATALRGRTPRLSGHALVIPPGMPSLLGGPRSTIAAWAGAPVPVEVLTRAQGDGAKYAAAHGLRVRRVDPPDPLVATNRARRLRILAL
ncbi:MAG: hypothetical protein ACREX3_18145, partial [Gammaproteobacteria bacterium]